MKKFSELKIQDKVLTSLMFINLAFWSLSKLPFIYKFNFFNVIYEAISLYMIVITLLSTFYFLYKWIDLNLQVKTIYFYGLLIGVLTMFIMRFLQ